MEAERSTRQQLYDFILRFKQRLGLDTINDMRTIEGKPVGTLAIPREDHPIFRPASLKPALLQC
jgi:hypothetical protein